MKNATDNRNTFPETRVPEQANPEMLISLGERLRKEAIACVHPDDLLTLCEKLIEIYDAPFVGTLEFRRRAARAVAQIAAHDAGVLSLIIENAASYAKQQHIDDASPYSPNAFEVLAEIVPIYERVTSFLHHIAEHDCGVARWSATQALLAIENVSLDKTGSGEVAVRRREKVRCPQGAATAEQLLESETKIGRGERI